MRALDHCVLPTADLSVARARLSALGFTVAPEGLHPFGTKNCCIYFADGTFLEPLAVADAAIAAGASDDGNVFTARDATFRQSVGQEGFSALAFGTHDAARDHEEFVRAGISAGPLLEFSRPFVDASGRSDTASFRLAFAAEPRASDAFFFTSERVNAPTVDRSALQAHANGLRRMKAVILEAGEPMQFADFLAAVADSQPVDTPDGLRFPAANGDLFLRRSASMSAGLRLAGIAFGAEDLRKVEATLTTASIPHEAGPRGLTVAPAAGQGTAFAFEALASA